MSKRQTFAAYETQYEGAQNTKSENFSDLYTIYTFLAQKLKFEGARPNHQSQKLLFKTFLKFYRLVTIYGLAEVSFNISEQEGHHGLSNFTYIRCAANRHDAYAIIRAKWRCTC